MAEQEDKNRISSGGSGQDRAFAVTIALTFAAVAVIFAAFYLLSNYGGLPMLNAKDADEIPEVQTSLWDSVILRETADAGEEYTNGTLFIGDGNFLRFVRNGILTYDNVIGLEGKGIQTAAGEPCVYFAGYDGPVNVAEAVRIMQPRRVLLNFGTNNLTGVTDNFIYVYRKLIDGIRENYPYTDIIVMSILPLGREVTTPYGVLTMGEVEGFNDALKEMCLECGVPFLNAAEALSDSGTGFADSSMMEADGIHLSQKGLMTVLNYHRLHAFQTEDRRVSVSEIPVQIGAPNGDGSFDCDGMLSIATSRLSKDGFRFSSAQPGEGASVREHSFTVGHDAANGTELEYAEMLCSLVRDRCAKTSMLTVTWSSDGNGDHIFTVREVLECEVHTYGEWTEVTAPTCISDGLMRRTCLVCGHAEDKRLDIDPDAHDIRWVTVTAPTYQSEGEERGTCSRCGKQWTRILGMLTGSGSTEEGSSSGENNEPDTPEEPGVQGGSSDTGDVSGSDSPGGTENTGDSGGSEGSDDPGGTSDPGGSENPDPGDEPATPDEPGEPDPPPDVPEDPGEEDPADPDTE